MANVSPSFAKLRTDIATGAKTAEAKKTTQLKTDRYAPTAPRDTPQNIVVYHFYRGMEEFFMDGLMDEPRFPDEYCKVALLRTTFKKACQITSNDGWQSNPAVKDTFPWVHYKNCADGFRETCSGDVLVEDNANAWQWSGSSFKYLGRFYNKAADPDPADGPRPTEDDDEAGGTMPGVFDDGESELVRAERRREEAVEARLREEQAQARADAEAAAAAAAKP
eukprot:c55517_g1_i1.p3 GENE.c55517_g1_i1~~c55517_g1_i1.p3  ORF type:complete len:232 (+),score=55.13 c55517_g1_i1:33-698(+)